MESNSCRLTPSGQLEKLPRKNLLDHHLGTRMSVASGMSLPNMLRSTSMASFLVVDSSCCSILLDSSSVTVTIRMLAPGYCFSKCCGASWRLVFLTRIQSSICIGRKVPYLPHRVVSSPLAGVQEELCVISIRPKLERELEEYLGVYCHVELVQRQDLPFLLHSDAQHLAS